MKKFMDKDFLLSTPSARKLYHSVAEKMPIVDYHCHIDPKEICEDRRFHNITEVWLGGDHYKWRLMRSAGVDEEYITGDAPDREKFQKWAESLELAIGNPLYHWSHLELQRYFGYDGILNAGTAETVWNLCNDKLQNDPDMTVRGIIRQSNVRLICTTDDPADTLEYHDRLAADDSFDTKVLPAWRPDRAMNLEKPEYPEYLAKLEKAAGVKIGSFAELKRALRIRMDYFEKRGCTVSDHAVEYLMYAPAPAEEIERIYSNRLAGGAVSRADEMKFKTAFLQFAACEYARRGWAMQIHFGCRRDNNGKMYRILGPDTGYDCISNYAPSSEMAAFLNSLNEAGSLPRVVLYSLNPNDSAAIGSVLGCFQDGSTAGKIQQGSAWWFNDHKTGMTEQMTTLANEGYLAGFVGMLTDSRSFLSYTRHEYFRRILCDLIGGWVEKGEYPDDEEAITRIVRGICYNNAVRYFRFPLSEV